MATNPQNHPRAQAAAAAAAAPAAETKTPDTTVADVANPAGAGATETADTLVEGEVVMLTAVHGFIHHPFQVPLSFNTDRATKVVVDRWVSVQFEAGKLKRA